MVPSEYVFLVGPISFSGPYCEANIVFQVNVKYIEYRVQGIRLSTLHYHLIILHRNVVWSTDELSLLQLDGTIIAPTNAKAWGSGLLWWIEFTKLRGITIRGNGVIDGKGSVWWQDSPFDDPVDDEAKLIIPLNRTAKENSPIPVIIFPFTPPQCLVLGLSETNSELFWWEWCGR